MFPEVTSQVCIVLSATLGNIGEMSVSGTYNKNNLKKIAYTSKSCIKFVRCKEEEQIKGLENNGGIKGWKENPLIRGCANIM